MSKELLGFWGPVAVAVIAGLFNIIVKLIEKYGPPPKPKGEGDPETDGKAPHASQKLRPWLIVAMIVWPLAGLVSLATVIWLPGPNDGWFFEIHKASVIVAVIIGVVLLIEMLRDKRKRSDSPPRPSLIAITIVLSLVYLVVLCGLGWRLNEWMSLAPSTKLVIAGFNLLDSKDYQRAITVTGECTSDFHIAATRLEQSLAGQDIPTGTVTLQQKQLIFSHGQLNDVVACYWIAGRSAEKLHRIDEAKSAYEKALAYPHARVWDPKGFFWSPAEDAADRLAGLQSSP